MHKKRLLDETLAFILKALREENANLPPDKQMGLNAYCKKYGILTPEHWKSIEKFEVNLSELDGGGSEVTGEEFVEEEG